MDDVYDLFKRGTELLEAGEFHQATVPLSKAAGLEPEKTSIREALGRAYFRSRMRLLLWSGICFIGLTANNILLFADKVIFPEVNTVWGVDFAVWRSLCAVLALLVLLLGWAWKRLSLVDRQPA